MSCGGALTHFSCKLGLKKFFFTALGGVQVHPLHPPGYAYEYMVAIVLLVKEINVQFNRVICKLRASIVALRITGPKPVTCYLFLSSASLPQTMCNIAHHDIVLGVLLFLCSVIYFGVVGKRQPAPLVMMERCKLPSVLGQIVPAAKRCYRILSRPTREIRVRYRKGPLSQRSRVDWTGYKQSFSFKL